MVHYVNVLHFVFFKKYTSLTLAQLTQLITNYRFTDIIFLFLGDVRDSFSKVIWSPRIISSSNSDAESSRSFATFLASKQHHIVCLLGHNSKLFVRRTTLSIMFLPVGFQLVEDRWQVFLVREDSGVLLNLIPVQLSLVEVSGNWVCEAVVSNLNLFVVLIFFSEEGLAHHL